MLVLDTTILIDALRRDQAALRKNAEIEAAEETVCTTQVNVLKLFKGAYLSARSDEGVQKVRRLLEALVILCIDEDTYECFGMSSSSTSPY
jgi:hypothetical protein